MALRDSLIHHEGWKNKPYVDTVGKVTIGVGFNLTDVGLYDDEIDFILAHRIELATRDAMTLTCYSQADQVIKDVLVELTYNLGIDRLRKFNVFLSFIDAGLYHAAADDLETTLWYKQVGVRGKDLCEVIRSAADSPKTPDPKADLA